MSAFLSAEDGVSAVKKVYYQQIRDKDAHNIVI
jgi:hypothetical protein